MYIILRNKYKFDITEMTEDKDWVYLRGNCYNLDLDNAIICLDKKKQSSITRIVTNG